jgi:hypothetical protein
MLDLTSCFTTNKNPHSDVLLGSRSKFISSLSTRPLLHSTAHSAYFQRMAQPNFQNRANAARASADELELIPNLPSVNLGEQMLQIQETLREMQQTTQQQARQLGQQTRQLGQQARQLGQQARQLRHLSG